MTTPQLRGLLVFETKGKCILCHGGSELTNASVTHVSQSPMERMIMGDLSIRVYDSGFYHVGTRKGHEDIGLADVDGIPSSGLPLSDAATAQMSVCAGGTAPIIPGRPGDGIPSSPLGCFDPIASYADVKTPGLRNVALTAPYFHNGGQLTLEQVVEFYDRGGDFPLATDEPTCPATTNLINCLMDPNVQTLGLTQQEKIDLVDFLRNGLVDSRTLNQLAPFDHPSLMVPNGHPVDSNGYPLPDPNNPGQAQDLIYDHTFEWQEWSAAAALIPAEPGATINAFIRVNPEGWLCCWAQKAAKRLGAWRTSTCHSLRLVNGCCFIGC